MEAHLIHNYTFQRIFKSRLTLLLFALGFSFNAYNMPVQHISMMSNNEYLAPVLRGDDHMVMPNLIRATESATHDWFDPTRYYHTLHTSSVSRTVSNASEPRAFRSQKTESASLSAAVIVAQTAVSSDRDTPLSSGEKTNLSSSQSIVETHIIHRDVWEKTVVPPAQEVIEHDPPPQKIYDAIVEDIQWERSDNTLIKSTDYHE